MGHLGCGIKSSQLNTAKLYESDLGPGLAVLGARGSERPRL